MYMLEACLSSVSVWHPLRLSVAASQAVIKLSICRVQNLKPHHMNEVDESYKYDKIRPRMHAHVCVCTYQND